MAATPGRLVFVLTMVAWLPASIHTGSSSSGWWGSQEAVQLRQAARRFISQGNFDQAERAYRRATGLAKLHRDRTAQAWFLAGAGDADLAVFHYRAALSAYLEAQSIAEQSRDPLVFGAVEADLASLYQQMGDYASALRAAERARTYTAGVKGVYYRPHLLLLLGRLRDDATSIPLYREGIQAARAGSARDPSLAAVEASGWDFLCEALLASGDLAGADAAAQQGIALRRSKEPRDLGFSESLLAEVRIKEASRASDAAARHSFLQEAQNFTEAAASERRGPPRYVLTGQRGRILLLRGRRREGLDALEQAVKQAQRWRLGVVAEPGALDGVAVRLQSEIFDRFASAAAAYGLETHDRRWIAEGFEAAELNRTINLRDNALSSRRDELPPEYWDVLGQLKTEELRLSQASLEESRVSDGLRLKLTELESRSGLRYSPKFIENFLTQASLIHFQPSLRDSDLFLSLSLGEKGSWLWAVTRSSLRVYRLPEAERIRDTVRAFRQAVEGHRIDERGVEVAERNREGTEGRGLTAEQSAVRADDLGHQLYGMLFGQLSPAEAALPSWQLSVDGELLEVPFAAVIPELNQKSSEKRSTRKVYLVEQHSLQVEAGALASGAPAQTSATGFVGVGDAIYNAADSRWSGATHSWRSWFPATTSWFPATVLAGSEGLNRLPGTGREVETSARAWQMGGGPITVLEGSEATRARFLQAIATRPRVIHLATHALVAPGGDQSYLIFGLDRDGQPELLGTSEIRTLNVPASLVTMTGCDTAPSDAPAGLGLAGLVRAWTIAGASAVVATEWPVQDSTGDSLLGIFYDHLRRDPQVSAPEALRDAQIEAIRSGTVAPSTWAAYQVFAGHTGAGSELP